MGALGLDVNFLLAQIINFFLFFIFFKAFLSKPFMKYVHDQQAAERNRKVLEEGAQKQKEAIETERKNLEKEMKEKMAEAISNGREAGEKTRQEIVENAKKEAAVIVEQAKSQLSDEQAKLESQAKEKAVDLSMLIVRNGLKDYLTEDAQKKITEHILSNKHLNA